MKKLIVGAALVAGTFSAHAADLPVKAHVYTKAPPPPAVYDWTGFYVGANVGMGLGRNLTHNLLAPVYAPTSYVAPFGAIGGGQIGYNWQTNSLFGPLVLGVEADIQAADMKDSYTNLLAGEFAGVSQKLDWFGTVRGRVGLATGPVLTYVTAGYAYGNVNTSSTLSGPGGIPTFGPFSAGSRVQGGWTWGSGIEAALGGNWTGKIEYLYVDLGNKSDYLFNGLTPQLLQTEVRENIFRVGLNYRIGGNSNYAPVPVANWSGLYIGGNFGSGTARNRSTSTIVSPLYPETFTLMPDGFIGGGQIGYNWQAANWVYGVEADFQGSTQRDNKACTLICAQPFYSATYDAKLPWFGTVRGRLGYSIGSTLFYATGGYAYGQVKTTENISLLGTALSASSSKTKSGWTVGAGIETPFVFLGLFGPNWTTKTEYLYVDLGSTDTGIVGAPTYFGTTTKVQEHIFRTGLNYKFNSPVIAKY